MPAFMDLTGQRYGRLVAIKPVRKGRLIYWECRCDCGNIVTPVGSTLRNGASKSCGCARAEWIQGGFKSINIKHGLFGTRIYGIWAGIVTRCTNKKDHSYPHYGGRGVSICNAWRNDPVQFYKDVGAPPDGMTLDRIDVNGNYEPSNCRWATPMEQANNRRGNVCFTHNGRTMTVSQWAREIGLSATGLHDRLKTLSVEEALTKKKREGLRFYVFYGEALTVKQLAEKAGLKAKTINQRLKDGWSVEEAVTTTYGARRAK